MQAAVEDGTVVQVEQLGEVRGRQLAEIAGPDARRLTKKRLVNGERLLGDHRGRNLPDGEKTFQARGVLRRW